MEAAGFKTIYWHRDLPPLGASPIGEHTIEASSPHVPGTIAVRDALWDRCEEGLSKAVQTRLAQEVHRLGGSCAHVLNEHIEVKRDPVSNEAWLHGSYTYVLYA